MIAAIPKEWWSILSKNITTEIDKTGVDIVQNVTKCTKVVYIALRDKLVLSKKLKTNRIKWEELLQIEIDDKVWSELYRKVCKLTPCTKLRYFQYKFLNGYLTTNSTVAKWDKETKSECTFCKKTDETLHHIFCECEVVIKLWKCLARWLDHFCGWWIDFSPEVIVLLSYKDSFPEMINSIILITKYYVYVQKCKGSDLNFQGLIHHLVKYKNVEMEAVKRVGNPKLIKKVEYKWYMFDMI